MAFVAPGPEVSARAIGSLDDVPPELACAFTPGADFEPLPPPARTDWLNIVRERGQSFDAFTTSAPPRPSRIGLQPIGDFNAEESRLLPVLERFARAFFGSEVVQLPAIAVDGAVTTRRNRFTGVVQLKTRDLLPLVARRVPGRRRLRARHHRARPLSARHVELCVRRGVGRRGRRRDRPREARPAILRPAGRPGAARSAVLQGPRPRDRPSRGNAALRLLQLPDEREQQPRGERSPAAALLPGRSAQAPVVVRPLPERYRQLLAFWRDVGDTGEAQWIERRLARLDSRERE